MSWAYSPPPAAWPPISANQTAFIAAKQNNTRSINLQSSKGSAYVRLPKNGLAPAWTSLVADGIGRRIWTSRITCALCGFRRLPARFRRHGLAEPGPGGHRRVRPKLPGRHHQPLRWYAQHAVSRRGRPGLGARRRAVGPGSFSRPGLVDYRCGAVLDVHT